MNALPNLSKLLALALGAFPVFCAAIKPKEDPAAQDLANTLRPPGLTAKADPGGMAAAKQQLSEALTKMEKSTFNGGPGAENLVQTAYAKFRPDVGPVHRAALVARLSAMWREARALGCFDEKHQFTGKMSIGSNAGTAVAYEYIVPLDQAPEFSKDLANVRLVSPYKARTNADKASPRDLAWLTTLNAISREVKGMASIKKMEDGPKTNAVGQTKEQADKIWQEEMKQDGEAALKKPSILLKGTMAATPSKGTGYKWRVLAEVNNLSSHATEVELQFYGVGSTHKYRKNYVMIEKKQKLQLREGEGVKVFLETNSKSSYKGRSDDYEKLTKKERAKSDTHYRGYIIQVMHGKESCSIYASDDGLKSMFMEDGGTPFHALPKLYMDTKETYDGK